MVHEQGGTNKGGKNIKVVDKRQKEDKRGVKRAMSKGKKKGGLTGNKKRRHHS